MITFATNENDTRHYAWRITYTHIDGTEQETTICQGWRSSWDDLFKARRGIAAVDCVGKLHFHDSTCDDVGEVVGKIHGKTSRVFKWVRN